MSSCLQKVNFETAWRGIVASQGNVAGINLAPLSSQNIAKASSLRGRFDRLPSLGYNYFFFFFFFVSDEGRAKFTFSSNHVAS